MTLGSLSIPVCTILTFTYFLVEIKDVAYKEEWSLKMGLIFRRESTL